MIDLRLGDCLEVMKTIPSKSIDAIICDPPYGTTACKWDSVIDFDLMWEQLNRIIKPNGAIVLFGAEPFSSALRMSNIKNFKYDWTWQKSKPTGHLNAKKQPLRQTEVISVFYKKQCTYNPQGTKPTNKVVSRTNRGNYGECSKTTVQTVTNYPRNIITFNSIDGVHQTQKPVDLMEYLINTYTNKDETVLDFTMGSGSTGVACKNTNRDFIGIEMDDKYFEIASERINGTLF
jgi:site-specific DNA-methyltransferase (adenine-specific)|tara:strand:+ start:674 stop:1372 length:699 start_codon:yes stop_codon:yes gene_type:complete